MTEVQVAFEQQPGDLYEETQAFSLESSPPKDQQTAIRQDSQVALSHDSLDIGAMDQQSISQPKNVLEVQRKVLQKIKQPRSNPIADKNAFETVGSNGIF